MPRKKKEESGKVPLPTHLTEVEMLKLELAAERERVRKLTEKSILAENDLLAQQEKLIHEQRKNVSQRYSEVRRINDLDREKRKNYMNELKAKFGIPEEEGLGYNPDTGEIIKE